MLVVVELCRFLYQLPVTTTGYRAATSTHLLSQLLLPLPSLLNLQLCPIHITTYVVDWVSLHTKTA